MAYEFSSTVRFSECGTDGLLTPEKMLAYFEDAMLFDDISCGFGFPYWWRKGITWVLTSWNVLIFERPKLLSKVDIWCSAVGFTRFRGIRNYTIRDEEGNMLAAATGKLALISLEDQSPARIEPAEVEAYHAVEPLPIPEKKSRILIPENAKRFEEVPVARHHIDGLQHVNNKEYYLLAESCLPDGFEIRKMRVIYHRQARLGDTMIPVFGMNGHVFSGAVTDPEGEAFALFELSDKLSEEDLIVAGL